MVVGPRQKLYWFISPSTFSRAQKFKPRGKEKGEGIYIIIE